MIYLNSFSYYSHVITHVSGLQDSVAYNSKHIFVLYSI